MKEKKEINVQIGEQVRLARELRKLTQEQLAEQIAVSTQYVSDLERGVVGASLQTVKNICMALNITSDSLLFGHPASKMSAGILEKCDSLSDRQIELLTGIIDNYVKAVRPE